MNHIARDQSDEAVWLLQRSMSTLFLRARTASESAMTIAEHFEGHPNLKAVDDLIADLEQALAWPDSGLECDCASADARRLGKPVVQVSSVTAIDIDVELPGRL